MYMARSMDSANIFGLKVLYTKVNGETTTYTVGDAIPGRMVENTKDNGKIT